MPGGMTGWDLAERLTARKPGLKVIYTSGYAGESLSLHPPLEPGRNFMRKPFSLQVLAETVRRRLDER